MLAALFGTLTLTVSVTCPALSGTLVASGLNEKTGMAFCVAVSAAEVAVAFVEAAVAVAIVDTQVAVATAALVWLTEAVCVKELLVALAAAVAPNAVAVKEND